MPLEVHSRLTMCICWTFLTVIPSLLDMNTFMYLPSAFCLQFMSSMTFANCICVALTNRQYLITSVLASGSLTSPVDGSTTDDVSEYLLKPCASRQAARTYSPLLSTSSPYTKQFPGEVLHRCTMLWNLQEDSLMLFSSDR